MGELLKYWLSEKEGKGVVGPLEGDWGKEMLHADKGSPCWALLDIEVLLLQRATA
jgi:hypothetical protein